MLNFKPKYIFFAVLFTLFSFSSYAEVVKKIEVNGNNRVSSETVAVFGDIQIGKDYELDDVNDLIKKLYETSFFSNISVTIENNILSITVEENPLVNEVVFNGEKAKKYKEKIVELLSLSQNHSFIESSVQNDINQILAFYRNFGFYFIKIDAEIEKLKNNKVNIIYTIDKGEKAKIAKIFFLGDKKIREKRLRDVITSQETQFWKVLARSVYLSRERIELDKRLLKNYYKNKGYYEVDIKSTNVEYSEGEGFVLTFNIDAGNKYRFKKIFADISNTLDESAFLSLEPEFNKLAGKYYSQKKLTNVLDKIDELSEQKDLQFINHNVVETLDGNDVEVKINIYEGEKVILERVSIVGNSVTNDSVIRSALALDEGDPFSTLLVNKSINKIKSRGIFGKVEHEILAGSSDDFKVLKISIEEKATGEIMAGAGIGTDGTSFQFAVTENNWLGRGIKLQSALNASEHKISGNIYVSNPNYNFSGNAVNAGLDVSSTDRSTTSGFKSSKTGVELGTSFEQYENVYIAPTLTAAFEDIEVQTDASESIKKMKGNFFNADLGYAIIVDERNQTYKPTRGHKTSFRQSLPIIQDSSSILNGFDSNIYHDFSEDVIGSLKIHARSITGVDDDVRLTNRLYLPRNRLRGFNTYKIGPKDGADYIGGNYAAAVSAEAQLPNILPESYKTDVGVFLDTGNLWSVDYSNDVDETNKIRAAIGISANIYTTIGPLSFTLAQDLAKADNDETESFNFRLGTSF
jgi:outer membrane protein insertion porin family